MRAQLDEGADKGRVMAVMVKDLVNIEEVLIRRESIRMRLGLRGAVVGRGGAGMRKVGDAAAELAAPEFETHVSHVQFLEIEAAAVQAQLDAQETVGVSNSNVEPPCHTSDQ